jgi:hypothetical protein
MVRRLSLLSGFAALALIAAAGLGSAASATEYYHPHKPSYQVNKAPTAQTATSKALSFGSDAVSSARNDNLIIQDNTKLGFGGKTKQLNSAPTAQSATSKAVSFGGAAISDAQNNNTIVQNNFGGRVQVNKAPTAQSATSKAISFGGPAVSTASNSNVVFQGNVK